MVENKKNGLTIYIIILEVQKGGEKTIVLTQEIHMLLLNIDLQKKLKFQPNTRILIMKCNSLGG